MNQVKRRTLIVSLTMIMVGVGISYQNCGNIEQTETDSTLQSENTTNALTGAVKACDPNKSKDCFSVSVEVKGLTSELVLQNNGYDDLRISRDGTYTFKQSLVDGSKYSAEVFQQPSEQICEVANGTGLISSKTSAVSINCVSVPSDCKKGEKNWSSSYSLGVIAATYSNNSNSSGNYSIDSQIELGMSQNKTAVVYYRNTVSTHARTEINMTPNTAATVNEQSLGIWHSVDENAGGEIIAAWSGQNNGSIRFAQKVGTVWQPIQTISIPNTNALEPNVAIANNGDAVITWWSSGTEKGCFMAHKQNGTWTIPTSAADRINPTLGTCTQPKVAMSKSTAPQALIVWEESSKVFMSDYDGTTWNHPASSTDYFSSGFSPEVAISDNTQRAIVVWKSGSNHYAATRDFGIWTFPGNPILVANNLASDDPMVKVNNLGNAIVVWPSGGLLKMNERIGGLWGIASTINPSASPASTGYQKIYDIALNNTGKAIITWTGGGVGGFRFFKSERLYQGAPWVHPSSPNDVYGNFAPGLGVGYPRVEVDEKCNAILAWINGLSAYRMEYE